MKKIKLIAGFLIGAFGLLAAFALLFIKQPENRVTIRLGDKRVVTTYRELGIEQSLSWFSAATLRPVKTNVDNDAFKHALLAFFPELADPETVASQFFVTGKQRKAPPTFHLSKMARQLAYDASRMQDADIEIEILPYDDTEEPVKTPEEIEAEKEGLSKNTLTISLEGDDIETLDWKINLGESGWIQESSSGASIDQDALREYLEKNVKGRVERPFRDAIIRTYAGQGKAEYAEVEGIARDGISFPMEKNVESILRSVAEGNFKVSLSVERDPAFIYNNTGADLGILQLLATGRSNFAGSPEGRAVSLEGPYRTADIPEVKKEKYRASPRRNEIFWYRKIIKATGEETEEQIISRYRTLPR